MEQDCWSRCAYRVSHSALPKRKIVDEDGEELLFSQQNCSIYLFVNTLPESEDRETADLYVLSRCDEQSHSGGSSFTSLERICIRL
jgi:hypothetical protein